MDQGARVVVGFRFEREDEVEQPMPLPLSPCAKSDCYPGGQFVVPKGVLPDGSHVFWLTVLGSLRFTAFDSKLKGAGGRAFEPQLAPPCVEYGWTLGGAKNFFLMDARDAVTRSASSFA